MTDDEASARRRAALGSALFLFAAPGVVAGLVPWLITGYELETPFSGWIAFRIAGAALIAAGAAALLHSFAAFAREGLGTPAPVAPTRRLVVGGLYRHVRNPMYVAVASLIVGQAMLFGSGVLFAYAGAFVVTVAAFVHLYEEPTLRRRFGGSYEAYRRAVPAWIPRLRPWRGDRG